MARWKTKHGILTSNEHERHGSTYRKSGGKGQGTECHLEAQGKLVHSLGHHLLTAERLTQIGVLL